MSHSMQNSPVYSADLECSNTLFTTMLVDIITTYRKMSFYQSTVPFIVSLSSSETPLSPFFFFCYSSFISFVENLLHPYE